MSKGDLSVNTKGAVAAETELPAGACWVTLSVEVPETKKRYGFVVSLQVSADNGSSWLKTGLRFRGRGPHHRIRVTATTVRAVVLVRDRSGLTSVPVTIDTEEFA